MGLADGTAFFLFAVGCMVALLLGEVLGSVLTCDGQRPEKANRRKRSAPAAFGDELTLLNSLLGACWKETITTPDFCV
jgi:hypothetical protein